MPISPPTSRGSMGLSGRRLQPIGSVMSWGAPGSAGAVQTVGRMQVAAIFIPAGTTVISVLFNVTAVAATSLFRPVIYSTHATYLVPGALLLDVGAQDTSVSTGTYEVTVTIPTFVDDTFVWAGGVTQTASATLRRTISYNTGGSVPYWAPIYGGYTRDLDNPLGSAFRTDNVTGAPPATHATVNAATYAAASGLLSTMSLPYVGLRAG